MLFWLFVNCSGLKKSYDRERTNFVLSFLMFRAMKIRFLKKVVYRIATIADYDREALYLRKMHTMGWKLKEVTYSNLVVAVKYTFEKCQPVQVSYQLDFYPMKKSDRASYLQLFKDYGWEHITDFNGVSYFRSFILELSRMPSLKFITTRPGS